MLQSCQRQSSSRPREQWTGGLHLPLLALSCTIWFDNECSACETLQPQSVWLQVFDLRATHSCKQKFGRTSKQHDGTDSSRLSWKHSDSIPFVAFSSDIAGQSILGFHVVWMPAIGMLLSHFLWLGPSKLSLIFWFHLSCSSVCNRVIAKISHQLENLCRVVCSCGQRKLVGDSVDWQRGVSQCRIHRN